MDRVPLLTDGRLKKPASLLVTTALFAITLGGGLGPEAAAQTDGQNKGWYIGGEAGVSLVPSIRFDANADTWHQQQDDGYALLGQVGYGFGQIRLEGEFGYRQNDLRKFTDAAGSPPPGGSIGGFSAMANAIYDFRTGTRWTPYLGAGAGGLDLSADNIKAGAVAVTNNSEWVFAYQGIAGLSYAVDDSLSIKADYHYLRSEKANLSLEPGYGTGNGSGTYAAHAILVGFTYRFAKPAAMAVAAPMPPPPAPMAQAPMVQAPMAKPVVAAPIARNFMVFFDWDKSDITAEAKAIIAQAADGANKNHSVAIALTGYTDLSGTVPYNLALSVRRGDAVKRALVELGIPAGEISVVGKGKSDPLVPTKDGVREPQNRRVTIILE
jgi:outer membrane protein OmpA-like peptidoglycan-associated protein